MVDSIVTSQSIVPGCARERSRSNLKCVRTRLPSPCDVTLHRYDRTSYNGHSAASLPGVDVAAVHGVFGGWSASDYTSTTRDACLFANAVYGPRQRILSKELQDVMIPWDDR